MNISETNNSHLANQVYYNNEDTPDTVKVLNNNINWNFFVGPIELYFDKSWITYDKIYGDADIGSRFYCSIYTEILETGVTYEYKNYYTPYLLKSVSNPPIVYREGSSVLASRNSHSINFGNEIGHQVDFNKNLFENINILGNLSFSYRHQKDGMAELSIMEFFAMNEDAEIYDYYPFRQMYLEVNGWALSERLYYKLGVDYFTELIFLNSGKNTYALTFPTHWVWKLSNGSSVTAYLEMQSKTEKQLNPLDFSLASKKNYTNNYLSFSYNHFGKWTLTGFYDREISKGKKNARAQEIQRLIGRSLRGCAYLEKMPDISIIVDCDVINADGGTRTASINGGYIALALAIKSRYPSLLDQKIINPVAAISVGKVNGKIIEDLNYEEDSNAEVDLNIVMNHENQLIEIQGTGEQGTFSKAELNEMLVVGTNCISKIFEEQNKIIEVS